MICTANFTLVHVGKYRTEDKIKNADTKHSPEKQTMQNTAKQTIDYPGLVAFYVRKWGGFILRSPPRTAVHVCCFSVCFVTSACRHPSAIPYFWSLGDGRSTHAGIHQCSQDICYGYGRIKTEKQCQQAVSRPIDDTVTDMLYMHLCKSKYKCIIHRAQKKVAHHTLQNILAQGWPIAKISTATESEIISEHKCIINVLIFNVPKCCHLAN